ncbi:NUDIX hydrolase [Pseudobacteriovorax antillogorgiicola]|uniref:GDP-mannose pyrophosphatase n=1 Tax=Pseudobacteriovorax antillogorgiicola TaxID=1513793 RepID=A0A1Y6B5G8_9BACT|nr:NUDIX hydrolase [Pseudobacteriovorax antillogorgiicola]TCS59194.1 NUDIX domain-containing protein [Pseudobacteriovorax antillogorgiicola]SME90697.1 NUDIX domain-containing protein [Pseudobacteriovorax antillogorgiicola]
MQWTVKQVRTLLEARPFAVQAIDLIDNRKKKELNYPFYRLKAPDWVNVLAITEGQKAVLVKQQRVGTMTDTLEIPGGVIDEGEDPKVAAIRELEEETGYRAKRVEHVATINPNPAIMTNNVHMFVALDCAIPQDRKLFPDENESIDIITCDVKELIPKTLNQEINSALAALTIHMCRDYFS